jgi:hypothetical protein
VTVPRIDPTGEIIDPFLTRLYRLIEAERCDQDSMHGGPAHDDTLDPRQWTCILARHVGLSTMDAGVYDLTIWRRQMVRIAATALAALEAELRRDPRSMHALIGKRLKALEQDHVSQ